MFIADAQVHIWGPNTPERPWLGSQHPHTDEPLFAEHLLRDMDAVGVTRAILVPPNWDGGRHDLVLAAAKKYPDRFAVMRRVETAQPVKQGQIAQWCSEPGVLGLRCGFNKPASAPALKEGRIDWLWSEAQQAGAPIMVTVTHAMAPLMDNVAARHPQLKLVIDHLGLTAGQYDAEAYRDLDKLLALAKRPNIAVKASALPVYSKDKYPYHSLHPYLKRVYEAFGPRRIFWGTDLARLPCTYREALTMFTEEMPWLSAIDKEWIMGRGLCTWLGWDIPAAK